MVLLTSGIPLMAGTWAVGEQTNHPSRKTIGMRQSLTTMASPSQRAQGCPTVGLPQMDATLPEIAVSAQAPAKRSVKIFSE